MPKGGHSSWCKKRNVFLAGLRASDTFISKQKQEELWQEYVEKNKESINA